MRQHLGVYFGYVIFCFVFINQCVFFLQSNHFISFSHVQIGMHFSQAVAIIQSQVNVIKGVQVLYSETVSVNLTKPRHPSSPSPSSDLFAPFQNPLDVDIVINLPTDGFRLIFDAVVQRLKIIEVYNMKAVKLKY